MPFRLTDAPLLPLCFSKVGSFGDLLLAALGAWLPGQRNPSERGSYLRRKKNTAGVEEERGDRVLFCKRLPALRRETNRNKTKLQ